MSDGAESQTTPDVSSVAKMKFQAYPVAIHAARGRLTYYTEEDAVGIILFLGLKLADVFSLCIHTEHLQPHCQVAHGGWLREAIATIRNLVFEPGQAFGFPSGVDAARPLSVDDVAVAPVHTDQVDVFSQDRCDVAVDLKNGVSART